MPPSRALRGHGEVETATVATAGVCTSARSDRLPPSVGFRASVDEVQWEVRPLAIVTATLEPM